MRSDPLKRQVGLDPEISIKQATQLWFSVPAIPGDKFLVSSGYLGLNALSRRTIRNQ